eukprot:scaffold120802_cov69-Phaeocystis_antarctica.AAC.1
MTQIGPRYGRRNSLRSPNLGGATSMSKHAALRVPRFYLHGEGALDFRHEISAILRLAAEAVDELVVRRQFEGKQFDGKWQHAADVFVVQHLYSHPSRVHILEEAELHVLAG